MERKVDIARALKDKGYYNSLNDAERALVPENPVGSIELSDADLENASGGLIDQTGTGAPECRCEKTQTADSNGGACYCTCPSNPSTVIA
ncbi:MAG TPA: mersacidin/lichenicidin family type 2 lantibiotic [Thermoanaerobaculia bacterium]|nr:mersacidin/lichenicidin family type 2 lantibiotic [Thermoanaerobaculia bacterium]